MSFEPLPPNLEKGINRFAREHHLSHDEAVIKLIETGLTIVSPPTTMSTPQAGRLSQGRARRGPRPPLRTDDPEAIIGLFADAPGFRESIDAVIARRAERYGFAE